MNKRMQAREWKRTEKTRCYLREFEFELFIHVNDQHGIETRMDILKYETGMPQLNQYVIGTRFDPAPCKRGDQFIIPPDTSVVDFILQFSRIGKYPAKRPTPVTRVSNQHSMTNISSWGNDLGKMVFTYQVNEYLEKQEPMTKLPWRCRVWGGMAHNQNNEVTCYWDFRNPVSMKAWLNKARIIKSIKTRIQAIEDEQTYMAMKKLSKA